jgi:metallo-beta-lactamase class B
MCLAEVRRPAPPFSLNVCAGANKKFGAAMKRCLLLSVGVLAASLSSPIAMLHTGPAPQAEALWRSWNQPVAPFRIIGNIYYVGASDITSFLIVTPQGNILLDGGFVETAPQIEAYIQALGFNMKDVKILLSSHAHFDHAGGLAELKRATGATFYASTADAPMLERGGHGDFSFGDRFTFPPVKPERLLKDGDTLNMGGTTMTAHLTPGHTKGCTTWTTTAEENGKSYPVIFVCSASVPGHRLVNNPAYPNIAEDYERTFQILRSLPGDIFLAPHGSFFDLTPKREALSRGAKANLFIDPAGYRAYVAESEKAFREDLERQQKAESAKVPSAK